MPLALYLHDGTTVIGNGVYPDQPAGQVELVQMVFLTIPEISIIQKEPVRIISIQN